MDNCTVDGHWPRIIKPERSKWRIQLATALTFAPAPVKALYGRRLMLNPVVLADSAGIYETHNS